MCKFCIEYLQKKFAPVWLGFVVAPSDFNQWFFGYNLTGLQYMQYLNWSK